MTFAAVITAAGSSVRFGTGCKKEFELLAERPVLYYSVQHFVLNPQISTVVVTHTTNGQEQALACLTGLPLEKVLFAEGGSTRQKSVFNALKLLASGTCPDFVLIHDGARPFVTEELIKTVMTKTIQSGAAVPALFLTDALKSVNQGFIVGHHNRNHFCTVQTPQGFKFLDLYASHQKAIDRDDEFFDDTQVYALSGHSVATILGDEKNLKITFQKDLEGQK